MKDMNKENISKKARMIRPALVIGFILAIMVIYATFPRPVLVQDEDMSWHIIFEGNLAEAAEGNPGAGAGGILEIFFVNHTDANCAENTSATIEGWCDANDLGYANADDFNVELAHSTAFDIIVRVRGNETMCDRGGDWFPADLKVEITSADLGLGVDTAMTGTVTYNNTAASYLWMNFEHDNADAGFTLSKDETNTITSIKFSAYY